MTGALLIRSSHVAWVHRQSFEGGWFEFGVSWVGRAACVDCLLRFQGGPQFEHTLTLAVMPNCWALQTGLLVVLCEGGGPEGQLEGKGARRGGQVGRQMGGAGREAREGLGPREGHVDASVGPTTTGTLFFYILSFSRTQVTWHLSTKSAQAQMRW